jgi:hypothetical protein
MPNGHPQPGRAPQQAAVQAQAAPEEALPGSQVSSRQQPCMPPCTASDSLPSSQLQGQLGCAVSTGVFLSGMPQGCGSHVRFGEEEEEAVEDDSAAAGAECDMLEDSATISELSFGQDEAGRPLVSLPGRGLAGAAAAAGPEAQPCGGRRATPTRRQCAYFCTYCPLHVHACESVLLHPDRAGGNTRLLLV